MVLLLSVGALIACSDSSTTAPPAGDGHGSVAIGDLVQGVTVTPAVPVTGGTLTVRSVITNRGSEAAMLTSRVCGLDLHGTIALIDVPGSARCDAISMSGPLAPGDSVLQFDWKLVTSSPGHYVLAVEHALEPSAVVEVGVHVVGAP